MSRWSPGTGTNVLSLFTLQGRKEEPITLSNRALPVKTRKARVRSALPQVDRLTAHPTPTGTPCPTQKVHLGRKEAGKRGTCLLPGPSKTGQRGNCKRKVHPGPLNSLRHGLATGEQGSSFSEQDVSIRCERSHPTRATAASEGKNHNTGCSCKGDRAQCCVGVPSFPQSPALPYNEHMLVFYQKWRESLRL